MKENKFDARTNFEIDDDIENLLNTYFKKYNISGSEICHNFPIYSRRTSLKRFLAHYELFRKTINLPGDIIELGIYRGLSLMSWANFLEIRNMGDRQKQIFGFDNFKGITSLDKKDGKSNKCVHKIKGGYNSGTFENALEDAIAIYDNDRFIPYKPRIVLVKGDIEKTVPKFIEENPGLRISLMHFDCDMYKPTKIAIEAFWPLIVPGGVILFDEYGIRPWEGESRAIDEYLHNNNIEIKIQRFDWSPNPGGYIIKKDRK